MHGRRSKSLQKAAAQLPEGLEAAEAGRLMFELEKTTPSLRVDTLVRQ